MHTCLETGETLKCRKCGVEVSCIDTTEGLKISCSVCEKVIIGDHAEAMCFEQKLYIEASRYQNSVKQNPGCAEGIPIPDSVKRWQERLAQGAPGWPLPNWSLNTLDSWPFHYT